MLAAELRALGASRIVVAERTVYFCGDMPLLYRANLCLRTAYRILKPIYTLPIRNEKELYTKLNAIRWTDYFSAENSIAIEQVVVSELFPVSQQVLHVATAAITDWFSNRLGRKPAIVTDNPFMRLHLQINDDTLVLSLDASGDPLHQRGYRREKKDAPINEALAAGLLLLAGWKGEMAFTDAMCGSGTFPIEAAMIAANIAPNRQRKHFGFMNWKEFNGKQYKQVQAAVKAAERPLVAPIHGSDNLQRNIFICEENAKRMGVAQHITFRTLPIQESAASASKGMIVLNPPYGERLMPELIDKLYTEIGDTLRRRYRGWDAWILSGDLEALRHIGLRQQQHIEIRNGKTPCEFRHYPIV